MLLRREVIMEPDTLITMMDEFDNIAAKYGYQIGIASLKEDDEDNTIIRRINV